MDACFEAGALATGCSLDYEELSPVYSHMEADPVLLQAYRVNAEALGRHFDADDDGTPLPTFSTDMANVSLAVPTIHPLIGIETHGAVNHQREFAAACVTAVGGRRRARRRDRAGLDGHRRRHGSGAARPAARRVITEHAVLEVIPGQEDAFVEAMEQAKALIAASPGFVSLRVERCVERPGCFLLLVEWERLEDHTEGFRGSAAYQEWRAALHHFYDPFPVVEHFEAVVTA